MHNRIIPVTTSFIQTICAAVLLFLAAPIAHSDSHEPRTDAEPVMAETGADGIQRLEITLDSYSFAPAYIVVQAGKPVELRLRNVTTITPHNFRLESIADGLDLDKDVAPGKAETLSFSAAKPGMYEFYCDEKLLFFPSHKEKGMIGKLEVR